MRTPIAVGLEDGGDQSLEALLPDSYKELLAIAARLDISPRTVEFHKYSMMETLGISSNAELIRFALESGANEI